MGYNVKRVELISAGVVELLKSSEVANDLKKRASAMSGRCGEGYTTADGTGHDRAYANVIAESKEARRDCLKNNTLINNMY